MSGAKSAASTHDAAALQLNQLYRCKIYAARLQPANFFAGLLAELGDAMGEARYFPAGGLLMDDATLRGTHDNRFGSPERRHCHLRVAAGDRFFDFADRIAQQSAARLVDFGLARDLARGFAGRTGIGHAASR